MLSFNVIFLTKPHQISWEVCSAMFNPWFEWFIFFSFHSNGTIRSDLQVLSKGPIFLDGVRCKRHDHILPQCCHNEIGVHDCTHAQDVVLTCKLYWTRQCGGISTKSAHLRHSNYITQCFVGCNYFSTLPIPGPRLNIKTVLSTYGDFHVKDKTAVRTSYL